MISTKKHIQNLAALLLARDITDVIISPGSRSGPLAHTLAGCKHFNCRSIVDERSAGYFAVGLAQAIKKPVAMVCSSGTAALNFAPAVAEAFYQNIPLIVLTADRPDYLINQGENQTLPQQNIFRDFCKKEITLPLEESDKPLWHSGRIINEALFSAVTGSPGPVHINIPLEEPLHQLVDQPLPDPRVIIRTPHRYIPAKDQLKMAANLFNRAEKIMILPGQHDPDSELQKILAALSKKTGAIILKEQLSNLNHPLFVENGDLLAARLLNRPDPALMPDLVITFGGSIVSKNLRKLLKRNPPVNHWHIDPAARYYDTWQSLTQVFESEAKLFLSYLMRQISGKQNDYQQRWKLAEANIKKSRNSYLHQAGFCDMTIVQKILTQLPENSVLHLGNSTPVRYALMMDMPKSIAFYGNRGVSGIDGSLSTAVGFASQSDKINTIILGDLSFFYDSNALWNQYVPRNLRIIVLHNGGGNIFGMIDQLSDSPAFEQFFYTKNKISAQGLAQTYGINYLRADSQNSLEQELFHLYNRGKQKARLLEVFTNAAVNTTHYRNLFKALI